MNILRISMIIIALLVTIGMTALTFLTLQNNIEKQNKEEKIQTRVHAIVNNHGYEKIIVEFGVKSLILTYLKGG